MRLIDADKVIVTRYDYEKPLTLKERLYRLLDKQPTVEAIPVEWIKKKIKEKKERFVGYCDELTPVFVMYEQVLSDWEKENEID